MRLVLVIVSCVEGTQKRRLCFRLDRPVILSHWRHLPMLCCLLLSHPQPRSQGLSSPHPKGSEGRKTLVQAGTCLGNKFIFKGGVLIYQSIVAAAVCYLLNRLPGQPWKALFRFRSEDLSYQVHCFQHLKLNWIWKLWKDKNVKL